MANFLTKYLRDNKWYLKATGVGSNADPFVVTVDINTTQADDAAFTVGTSKVQMMGALADEAAPDSVNEGDGGALRMALNRALHVVVRDDAGGERGLNVDANGRIGISETIADDAAFTPATTRVFPIAGEFDDAAPDSVDEGDAGAIRMSGRRELYTQIRDAAGNERGANVDASNRLAVLPSSFGAELVVLAGAAHTAGAGQLGAGVALPYAYRRLAVIVDITASAHEAGDTLDVWIDFSPDSGTTWVNGGKIAQQAGDGAAVKQILYFDPSALAAGATAKRGVATVDDAAAGVVRPETWGNQIRARWTVTEANADADASHTFSVKAYGMI